MDSAPLEGFVDHARSALDADPEMSTRTAELRITQPLLEALGWDVRGPEVQAGYRVEDEVVGFALGQGDDPSVLVETIAPSTSIDRTAVREFVDTMQTAEVEWGILLDGHRYCLVASVAGSVDYVDFRIDELPENLEAISYYGRDAVVDRETTRQATRRRAAERLTKRRDEVIADLADRLVDVTGEELRSEAVAVAERIVDEFAADLRGDRVDGSGGAGQGFDAPPSGGGNSGDERSPERSAEGKTDAPAGAPVVEDGNAHFGSGPARSAGDHEYVVRLFDGGTSIGAVRAASLGGVLEQTIAYLDEGRDLLRSLSMPWSPEDWDRSVIARDSTHPDGSPMGSYERLSSGHVLLTDMDESEYRDVVEALAGAVGLRVMFQGDWDD
ncbi:MAG: hypothetical protein ACOCSP_00980 [archaeon]